MGFVTQDWAEHSNGLGMSPGPEHCVPRSAVTWQLRHPPREHSLPATRPSAPG